MREAPSRVVIDALARARRHGDRYDPVAMPRRARSTGESASASPARADGRGAGADALVIVTEWKAFRSPDFDELKRALKAPVIFDGRNLYEPAVVRSHGFEYHPIGR
jgi:UDPglucose 6-dehydrogenase